MFPRNVHIPPLSHYNTTSSLYSTLVRPRCALGKVHHRSWRCTTAAIVELSVLSNTQTKFYFKCIRNNSLALFCCCISLIFLGRTIIPIQFTWVAREMLCRNKGCFLGYEGLASFLLVPYQRWKCTHGDFYPYNWTGSESKLGISSYLHVQSVNMSCF